MLPDASIGVEVRGSLRPTRTHVRNPRKGSIICSLRILGPQIRVVDVIPVAFHAEPVGDNSGIEWTDATRNPVTGCTQVSPGCDRCYALTFAERSRGVPGHPYEQGFDLKLWPAHLELPLRWKRPRRNFVNSMSDLFHEAVPVEYIRWVFDVMVRADRHVFQVLIKRPRWMSSWRPTCPGRPTSGL